MLIVTSGNIVHNLRAMDGAQPDGGYDWAQRFDGAARAQLTDSPGDILTVDAHSDYHRAVPTPDHFLPMVYFAGLAAAAETLSTRWSVGTRSDRCR